MRLACAVAALGLLGCGKDVGGNSPAAEPGGPDGSGPDIDASLTCTLGSGVSNVAGTITASTTWHDTVNITANTTINAGVTVTVMACTTINVTAGARITLAGTLD